MARLWICLLVLLLVGWTSYAYLTRDPIIDDRSGFDLNVANWPPSSAELTRQVGANGQDPNTPDGANIRRKFATLFKNRYRNHTPMMAIGLRFDPSGRIILMTPARMEPWNMDRLAVETWHETQAIFGHSFDIDLYITYIGAPPLKIGELRPAPGAPNRVSIVHLDKAILVAPERSHAVRTTRLGVAPVINQQRAAFNRFR